MMKYDKVRAEKLKRITKEFRPTYEEWIAYNSQEYGTQNAVEFLLKVLDNIQWKNEYYNNSKKIIVEHLIGSKEFTDRRALYESLRK